MLTGKLSMGGLNEKQAVPIYYIYKKTCSCVDSTSHPSWGKTEEFAKKEYN